MAEPAMRDNSKFDVPPKLLTTNPTLVPAMKQSNE